MGYASMRNGGAFEMRFWNWIMMNAGRGSRAARDPQTAAVLKEMADNRHDYLSLLPLRRGTTPLKLAPEYEDWLVEAMRHGANDAFWEQNNIVDHPERYQDIPVYLVGGWYDSWAGNTTANYRALTRQSRSSPVYLIMGPWIHGGQGASEHGQVSFGPDAAIADPLAWRLEWYDRWLKDDDSTVGKADPFRTPVRIFVMGTGDGRKTENGTSQSRRLLARRARVAAGSHAAIRIGICSPAAGCRRRRRPRTAARRRFEFDPRNPVPTIGGNISSGNDIMLQGAWDQRGGPHVWNWTQPIPLSARNDVLVFQSEPLAEDMEVTGEIEVEAVDLVDCGRHRLHGQADRRLSAQRRFSRRLRPEHRRRHPAGALSRVARAREADGSRARCTSSRSSSIRRRTSSRRDTASASTSPAATSRAST